MTGAPLPQEQAGDRVMIHANALLIGAAGALLRGPSGAGKSGLCLELIDFAQGRGVFARLIGDDRIEIVRRHGRLVARPHPAIAGAIEERGRGVGPTPYEPAGTLRCLVDLRGPRDEAPPRYPQEGEAEAILCGVALPRLAADAREAGATRKIFSFVHQFAAF
ncbi:MULTISPECIES: HPr kinase/phosphorylase [Methylosinus]|uniref:Aldolase n=1 Tax=Methylosinus sporium TaxID=428 RepID=A0A2U1SWH7_METSR|nr:MULTISPECIES: HPr kinase/phosphatase C-terminal domain-containing protein [Methylosinus]MBU3888397.1 HPr kinase/phosphatase C-terminal domain-containing protein [Methylosinus sp. KRF6]PWB95959.1 aldolase [Methylosinus sporium]